MKHWYKVAILFFVLSSYAIGAFLEGPYVSNIKSNSVVIWWKSNPPLSGQVFLKNRIYKKSQPPFEILIKGLKPDTTYKYYVIFSNGKRLPQKGSYKFHTASEKEKAFKFAVIADSRGPFSMIPLREDILEVIFKDVIKRDVQFICFLGDLVYGYATTEKEIREEFRLWKDVASFVMRETPIYTIMGNHDVVMHEERYINTEYLLDGVIKEGKTITSEDIFADEFVNPDNSPEAECQNAPSYKETCYSFDWGNSHFVFINTDYWIAFPKRRFFQKSEKLGFYKKGNPPGRIMDKQIEWIEADLKEAKSKGSKHIFVFGHHPIFPISDKEALEYSKHVTDKLKKDIKERRKRLWAIFAKYKVDAAFFGHEHNYSRAFIKGTWQIITGGAGAPLHSGPNKDLPWARYVKILKKRYHYCVITVQNDGISIEVYALKGNMKDFELIDHASL